MIEDYVLHTVDDEIVDDYVDSTVLCDVDFNDLLANHFFRNKRVRDTIFDCDGTICTLHFTIDAIDTKNDIKSVIDDWVQCNSNCTKACDDYIKIFKDDSTNSYLVIVECKPCEILNELTESYIERKGRKNNYIYTCNGKVITSDKVKKYLDKINFKYNNNKNVYWVRIADSELKSLGINTDITRTLSAKGQSMIDAFRKRKDDCKFKVMQRKGNKITLGKSNVNKTNVKPTNVRVKGTTYQDAYDEQNMQYNSVIFIIEPEIGKFDVDKVKRVIDDGLGSTNNIDNLCTKLKELEKTNHLYFRIKAPFNKVYELDAKVIPFSMLKEFKYQNGKTAYLYYKVVQA